MRAVRARPATVTLKLELRGRYSRPIVLGAAAGGLSATLWIAAGFVGGDARLVLVYTAGCSCALAVTLLWAVARLGGGQPETVRKENPAPVRTGWQSPIDPLTGLVNRASFEDHLRRAIARARRHPCALGVLCIDMDHFKHVNDTLGHPVGDKLLQQVAHRIEACLRATDIVARWGGDEFLVALPELSDRQDAVRIAGKLAETLRDSYEVDGHHIAASGTIGISLYPDDGLDQSSLCENADRAMYRAKSEGRGSVACYAPELGELARGRLELERDLRDALGRGELVLFYQPQVDLKTKRLVALEALLRWRHPRHGLLRPDSFLSLAEDSGLILPIGAWGLEAVCQQVRSMQASGGAPVPIGLNVSRTQFLRPGFEEAVKRAVGVSGIEPALLSLELTESMVMRDFERARHRVERLRSLGVRISIDDFGAGGASLALLQKLRVDSLKIDRSFIQGLGTSCRTLQLVDSIIRLTRSLGVAAVAEGVESIPQLKALRSVECNLAQGYLFGVPLPAADIGRWMAQQRAVCPIWLRPILPAPSKPASGLAGEIRPLFGGAPPTRRLPSLSLSVER